MIEIPHDCPREQTNCKALANIVSDVKSTFFCCGENNGDGRIVLQDKYTVCFKGPYRDVMDFYDKRDLIHHSSVMLQAVAAVEKCHDPELKQEKDWSPWEDL
jgi:hypothetical protein